jgi:fructoselysine transporter
LTDISESNPEMKRELGLLQATALNMIDMVGIGPFVVIPFIIGAMKGPQCIIAWIVGALLAYCDGTIWSELGAALPKAGGSYFFLKELYGENKWGRLMSFLYTWQTIIQAPLVIASGAIGFAQYLSYLIPISGIEQKAVSGVLVLVLMFLLYRKINTIGKISVLLWSGVLITLGWMIFGGLTHFNTHLAFSYPKEAFTFSTLFFAGLGAASVKTVYSYLGYYNVCHLGGEIRNPQKNIPRSIFISISGIAVIYILLQLSVLGVMPWQEASRSNFIVSTFIERIYGHNAADIATILILWIAFASLFAVMLGYSRIPYAAAIDGNFFTVFAKLHPKKNFPYISLLTLGSTAFVFSLLFKLSTVITAIIAMRIVVQFLGQAFGLLFFRKKDFPHPWKMYLYPLPVIISIVIWLFIFLSTGKEFMFSGLILISLGIVIFLFKAYLQNEWPLQRET